MEKEVLINTLKSLKKDAIEQGKKAKEKSIKDFYFGETLAYINVIKLLEA